MGRFPLATCITCSSTQSRCLLSALVFQPGETSLPAADGACKRRTKVLKALSRRGSKRKQCWSRFYHNRELPREKFCPGIWKYHGGGRAKMRKPCPERKRADVPFFVLAGFNSAAARPSRSEATLNYGNTKLAW